jgi:hypothetical protein
MVHDARICGSFFDDINGAKQAGVATDPTAPFTLDVFSVTDTVALAGQVFDLTYRLTPC